jgi:hypothetical protein
MVWVNNANEDIIFNALRILPGLVRTTLLTSIDFKDSVDGRRGFTWRAPFCGCFSDHRLKVLLAGYRSTAAATCRGLSKRPHQLAFLSEPNTTRQTRWLSSTDTTVLHPCFRLYPDKEGLWARMGNRQYTRKNGQYMSNPHHHPSC